MKYGVTINEKNTLTEWGLILLANVKAEAPKARTKYVTIPEMDGVLDLTESLTGRISYNQRTVSFELFAALEEDALESVRAQLAAYANGKRVKLWLPDDPSHYFYGRMSIGGKGAYHNGKIAVSMVADPWKYKTALTTVSITANGNKTLSNEAMPTVPVFVASKKGPTVAFGSVSHSLVAGRNSFDDIVLQPGDNQISVSNYTGTLRVEYQEGKM